MPIPIFEEAFVLKGWDAMVYEMPMQSGHISNVRAHWVSAGTWIDLHLSVSSDNESDRLRTDLKEFLSSVEVTQKP